MILIYLSSDYLFEPEGKLKSELVFVEEAPGPVGLEGDIQPGSASRRVDKQR